MLLLFLFFTIYSIKYYNLKWKNNTILYSIISWCNSIRQQLGVAQLFMTVHTKTDMKKENKNMQYETWFHLLKYNTAYINNNEQQAQ